MADTKVSALTAVSTPAGTDLVPIVQGGVSKNDSRDNMAAYDAAPIFCSLSSDYTLTSQTAAQKLFNASTNGAVTLAVGLYEFECDLVLTTMSATSGNGVFQFGGTAVLGRQLMAALALDSTTLTTGLAGSAAFVQGASAFVTSIAVAGTGTGLGAMIRGMFTVTTAGTLIPQIALTTAAAAVVKAGSNIRIRKVGANTDTTRGSWS